ncbi:hypothetical protein NIM87_03205 [Devosia sp. XJ19-1]|uniref:DUF3329 domain-containing protein n=1 Tax=Devosia ureilytica TaxID=2952754 RepID=A0A9Q4AL43_9HYPH|nr:hypothetical protein [Devosia ureilytica]MCP8885618.1 hypothetical protein [Devosia ureilytica]
MALKENDLKWFRPLWRRVAVAVFLALWLGWELFYTQDMFWAFLVGAALAYVAWNFFYTFPKEQSDDTLPPPGSPDNQDRPDP